MFVCVCCVDRADTYFDNNNSLFAYKSQVRICDNFIDVNHRITSGHTHTTAQCTLHIGGDWKSQRRKAPCIFFNAINCAIELCSPTVHRWMYWICVNVNVFCRSIGECENFVYRQHHSGTTKITGRLYIFFNTKESPISRHVNRIDFTAALVSFFFFSFVWPSIVSVRVRERSVCVSFRVSALSQW